MWDKIALDIDQKYSGSIHLEKQFATDSKTTVQSFLKDCREGGLFKLCPGLAAPMSSITILDSQFQTDESSFLLLNVLFINPCSV